MSVPAKQGWLSGWKEIAFYMGVSVRTAQRWHRQFGLPVYRPQEKMGCVHALPAQLDEWLQADRR